nr:ribonuclease H-like domain-containing protein [Tanacetum cinerariifolium]
MAGSDNESDDASIHSEATNAQQQPNIQPQIITTVSNNNEKFPYLKKDEYEVWAMKMEYYITNNDMNIRKVIQNGNSLKWTGRDRDGRVIILPPTTVDEHIAVQRESKARTTLLQSIYDDHVADFHYMDDARDIWNAIKARFGGNAKSKKIRKSMLKQEFSEFRIGEAKGLYKGYDRMQKILSQLNQLKAKPEDEDINLNTTSARKKMSYGDSPSYSSTTTYTAPSNSKTGAKGGNDKQRYSSFKIKEIGKKAEDSKALITVDTLVDWTDHDGESDGVIASKEFGMIAGCDTKDATEEGAAKIYNLITRADTEEASTAGDAGEFALMGVTSETKLDNHLVQTEKWSTSSKNLFRIIDSSMSVRTKVGLGFNNYIRENELGWDDSAFSVFTTNSEDVEGRPLFNRFAKADSMKVVPLPLSRDYTSLLDHIDLDESQMSYGTKSSTSSDSKFVSNDFVSCDDSDKSSEVNTNNFASSDSSIKSSELKPNDSTSCASTSSVSTSENEAEIESNTVGIRVGPVHSRNKVNHQNQFVPQAVLLRTGKVNIPPARPQPVPTGKPKVFAPVPTGRQDRPFPVPTDRGYSPSVISGWWKSTARPMPHFSRPTSSYFQTYTPYVPTMYYNHMKYGGDRWATAVKPSAVTFGGGEGRITGKGTIRTPTLDFENVYYVKQLQQFNLFFISQICDKKNKVLFTDTECLVLSKDFKLLDESMVVLWVPRKHNSYTINLKNLCPRGNLACLVVNALVDESVKWHRRMGHVNYKNMNRLVKGNLVRGLPLEDYPLNFSRMTIPVLHAVKMLYVDGTVCNEFNVGRKRPPTSFWTMELLKEREYEEINSGGSVKVNCKGLLLKKKTIQCLKMRMDNNDESQQVSALKEMVDANSKEYDSPALGPSTQKEVFAMGQWSISDKFGDTGYRYKHTCTWICPSIRTDKSGAVETKASRKQMESLVNGENIDDGVVDACKNNLSKEGHYKSVVVTNINDMVVASVLHKSFCQYLERLNPNKAAALLMVEVTRENFDWQTDKRLNDSGVCLMRHMEAYMGTTISKWSCRLKTKGRKQNMLLGHLRKKYAARLLFSECNLHRDTIQAQLDDIKVANVPVNKMKLPRCGK